jgi:hypothetical protein
MWAHLWLCQMILIKLLVAAIPFWPLKRLLLCHFFKYIIDPTARIGFSYIYPKKLCMAPNSVIGHANVCKGLSMLWMGHSSSIGRLNWISAFPKGTQSCHYSSQPKRDPRLVIGSQAAITNRHIIDCTDRVVVGPFATIAGFYSQFLTHSIDISASRQVSAPIVIGKYAFIGTRSVVLPGVRIPSYCVLAAGSVAAKSLFESYSLYGGVPARWIKSLGSSAVYFNRKSGFVE